MEDTASLLLYFAAPEFFAQKNQYRGTGRRKSAGARVRLIPGKGQIVANGKQANGYFGRGVIEMMIR